MRKAILTLFVALLGCTAYAKDIEELVVTTNPPMSCQNCENRIKGNLRFEKGVKNIETNLAEQRVVITYDADKTNPEKIEQAFTKIGYQATPISPDGKSVCPEEGETANCSNAEAGCANGGACCQKKN